MKTKKEPAFVLASPKHFAVVRMGLLELEPAASYRDGVDKYTALALFHTELEAACALATLPNRDGVAVMTETDFDLLYRLKLAANLL